MINKIQETHTIIKCELYKNLGMLKVSAVKHENLKRFGELVYRLNKGYEFFGDSAKSFEEKEKFYPTFEKIESEYSNLIERFAVEL